ncbi:MAG: hypothetical protein IJ840_00195 [Bacteroidales bacterium]|nr:hypothetical protein [Bacteroidales bacterium]
MKVYSPILADYLAWLFPPREPGGPLIVRAGNPMGKLLVAHCRVSDTPVKAVDPEEGSKTKPIWFDIELPDNDATWPLRTKWLWYSPADIKALNMALRATFDLDFGLYYMKGISQGLMKKDVVTAFVVSRSLFSKDSFESLHKRAYRKDLVSLERRIKQLLDKATYIDKNINLTGLNDD